MSPVFVFFFLCVCVCVCVCLFFCGGGGGGKPHVRELQGTPKRTKPAHGGFLHGGCWVQNLAKRWKPKNPSLNPKVRARGWNMSESQIRVGV